MRASTTPGKLRLLLAALVPASLAWGVLAALAVSRHASAADAVVATDEPLSLDAQQIYQSLADADVTVSAGQSAFAGLEAGVIVLALGMAAGCAWGISRRLAEYR